MTLTGAKAAHLARAAVAGLPVLPGFVLVPTERATEAPTGHKAVRGAWQALAGAHGSARVPPLHEQRRTHPGPNNGGEARAMSGSEPWSRRSQIVGRIQDVQWVCEFFEDESSRGRGLHVVGAATCAPYPSRDCRSTHEFGTVIRRR
ncbi:hypothetical protein [Streptomyces sp. NPDC059909]|uniref:hypothetical protein n=1 Tax=Streptomyces sp. NPDC059909 TaxID=3346998 RepID=UPI0036520A63